MKKPSGSYLILLTLTATFGGLLFGYDTAVISGTVSSLKEFFIDPYNWPETVANSRHGLVVSSALVGCIVGAMSGGLVSRYLGRKKGLQIAAILFLLSALGSAMPEIFFRPIGQADHTFLFAFVCYRIFGGIGVGMASMLSPLYIAEIAPANVRGKLVSWNQFAIIFGMLVVYFVNYSIARQGEDAWLHQVGWRWMFASEIIPASLFTILLLLVPETPRFHMLKGSEDRAFNVLSRINGIEKAKGILEEIKASISIRNKRQDLEKSEESGTRLSRTRKSGLFSFGTKVVIVGILLAMFQQFIGINVVLYYAPAIFRDMGARTDSSLLSTIYVGIVNLVFTILAIATVDRFGRRPLMITGAIVMAVSMLTLGLTFFLSLRGVSVEGELVNQFSSRFAAISAFSLILLFIAGFAMSWGPVTWVLLSEIFPNRIRGKALALATAAMWISNLIISWTFPVLNNSSFLVERYNHGAPYWIYGTVSIFAALFVIRFVPETKRKTLEELESYWRKN